MSISKILDHDRRMRGKSGSLLFTSTTRQMSAPITLYVYFITGEEHGTNGRGMHDESKGYGGRTGTVTRAYETVRSVRTMMISG